MTNKSISFKSFAPDNGSGMTREWIGNTSALPRKLFTILFCLFLGFGQMWGANPDHTASHTYTFTTSGCSGWTGSSCGSYCGGYGKSSGTPTITNKNISDFQAVDFDLHENVSLTIKVKGGNNGGTQTCTVTLIDKDGNKVSTYSDQKAEAYNGNQKNSAKDITFTFAPTEVFSGYKVSKPAKGWYVETSYILTYDDKAPSCQSWSDPTVNYSATTLTAGGTHATVSSISGTTYGAVSYASSNTSVLTVNASTGEVTPVASGTAKVTVSWAGNSTYCAKDVDVNFTINNPPASITLNNYSGSATTTGYYVDDTYELPSENNYSCSGGKAFVGWSTIEVAETDTKPSSNFYEPGASVTLAASNTFYAVFAKAGGSAGTEYVLTAASAVNAGTYIIAAYDATNSKYVTLTGATSGSTNVDLANETTGVTLTNSKFTTAPTGACEFTLAGNASDGFTIRNADANGYLGYTAQGTSRRLAFGNDYSTYTWKVGELEYDNYTTGCYIHRDLSSNYTISANGSSTTFIRGYSGSTKYKPIYFFKKTSNVTYTKYATTCCSTLGQINGSFS